MKTIYKYDSKGKLREWRMEVEGNKYRTIAGLSEGEKVTSAWTEVEGKNAGKSNETTAEQQAVLEVESKYKNKLSREYHLSPEEAKGGAHFFKPMLAETYKTFIWNEDVFVQPKLDGMRCIMTKDGMFSRAGKEIFSCPHIVESLSSFFEEDPNLILDGELYNHDLKNDFNKLMSLCKKQNPTDEQLKETASKVEYWLYDVPSAAKEPYANRLELLQRFSNIYKIVVCPTNKICKNELNQEELCTKLHAEAIKDGYEGSMIRLNKEYEQKRSKSLWKRKEFEDDEFEVLELVEGEGNWSGTIKSIRCRAKNDRTFGASIKGTKEYATSLIGKSFKTAKVRYFELTPDGVPRFGVVLALYENERDD